MSAKPPKMSPAPDSRSQAPAAWEPDLRWHLKALAGIVLSLTVLYAAMNAFLSRLPAPYGLRDIPPELTPWLKK
jgi:hypothetical protein